MKKDFYGSDLGKLQMHFHTSIRNIGLYLSVSLAVLGASRYYRKGSERSRFRQLMFTLVSLIFTTNAFLIARYLLSDHLSIIDKSELETNKESILKWYIIPKLLMGVSVIFIIFTCYLSLNTTRKIINEYIYE
tara:strand:- start:313 stop:711 length:399 start_codon:yes stop_codon:yes gene_type:complete